MSFDTVHLQSSGELNQPSDEYVSIKWLNAYRQERRADQERIQALEAEIKQLHKLILQNRPQAVEFEKMLQADYKGHWEAIGRNTNQFNTTQKIAIDIAHFYYEMLGVGIEIKRYSGGYKKPDVLPNVLKTGSGSGIIKWFDRRRNMDITTQHIKRAFKLLCEVGNVNHIATDGGIVRFEMDTVQEIEPQGMAHHAREYTGKVSDKKEGFAHTGNAETIFIIGSVGGLLYGPDEHTEAEDRKYHREKQYHSYAELKKIYSPPNYANELFISRGGK